MCCTLDSIIQLLFFLNEIDYFLNKTSELIFGCQKILGTKQSLCILHIHKSIYYVWLLDSKIEQNHDESKIISPTFPNLLVC